MRLRRKVWVNGGLGILIIGIATAAYLGGRTVQQSQEQARLNAAFSWSVDSQLTKNNGCLGTNVSPEIIISKTPEGTSSLALLMENKKGEVNWLMWDIPSMSRITEGVKPEGTTARSWKGNFRYDGPCLEGNANGEYILTVYAFKTSSLKLSSGSSKEDFFKLVKREHPAQTSKNLTYSP